MADLVNVPIEVLEEVEQAARDGLLELLDGGLEPGEALELVAALLDAALPLRLVLPFPYGELAERADGPALIEALRLVERTLRRDPGRVEARADRAEDRGNFLVAARRRARADRMRNRREG